MEALLDAVLYRQSCPTAAQLLDYHLGLLAGNLEFQLHRHIELCPHCTADLRDLMQIGLEVQPASTNGANSLGLLRRLQQLIPDLKLLPGVAQASMAMPALRGAAAADLRIFSAGDYRLSLSVSRFPSATTVAVEGNLLNTNDPAQALTGSVHLLRMANEELVTSESLDEFGIFSIAALQPDSYALAIELAAETIFIPNIVL